MNPGHRTTLRLKGSLILLPVLTIRMILWYCRRKHNVEELHKALEVFGTASKPKNNNNIVVRWFYTLYISSVCTAFK